MEKKRSTEYVHDLELENCELESANKTLRKELLRRCNAEALLQSIKTIVKKYDCRCATELKQLTKGGG